MTTTEIHAEVQTMARQATQKAIWWLADHPGMTGYASSVHTSFDWPDLPRVVLHIPNREDLNYLAEAVPGLERQPHTEHVVYKGIVDGAEVQLWGL